MKIAICEDEKFYSDKLYSLIDDFFKNKEIKTNIDIFQDGKPLIESLKSNISYDIIFLDIQLENSDGMEIASEIRKLQSKSTLIFVTNLENRAIEGYGVQAFEYIVKSSLDEKIESVLERFMESRENSHITFQDLNGDTAVVSVDEIIFIESEGRGTVINTLDSQIKTASYVGKTASLLPDDKFVEIHRSVFVQIKKIKRVGADIVEMCNGKKLPLSRRKRKQVLSAVMTSLKGGVL